MNYFKDWYKENKKELSKRRKQRYKRDAAYRKKCKERALDYYHSHKNQTKSVDRLKVEANGDRTFFTIGMVAKAINRKVQRVRELHQAGVIPQPLYFDRRGWRLYTQRQLQLLEGAFSNVAARRWTMNDVEVYLREHWEEENGKDRQRKVD